VAGIRPSVTTLKGRPHDRLAAGNLRSPSYSLTMRVACQRQSVHADQAAGLLRSQVPGHLGADVVLEAADGRTRQRTKDAVHVPFVVTQAVQYVLHPQPVRFGHTVLVGYGRHRRA
jgi:hypothetical protein